MDATPPGSRTSKLPRLRSRKTVTPRNRAASARAATSDLFYRVIFDRYQPYRNGSAHLLRDFHSEPPAKV